MSDPAQHREGYGVLLECIDHDTDPVWAMYVTSRTGSLGTWATRGEGMEPAGRRTVGRGGPGDLERLGEPSWGKAWLPGALAAPEAPRVRRPNAARHLGASSIRWERPSD